MDRGRAGVPRARGRAASGRAGRVCACRPRRRTLSSASWSGSMRRSSAAGSSAWPPPGARSSAVCASACSSAARRAAARRGPQRACSRPIRRRPAFAALARRSAEFVAGVCRGARRRGLYALRLARPRVRRTAKRAKAGSTATRAARSSPASRRTASAGCCSTRMHRSTHAASSAALAERLDDLRTNADVVDVNPDGVELADGSRIDADRVVLAAGAWTARRLAKRLPLRPVKGQTLRLRGRCRRRGSSAASTSMSSRGRAVRRCSAPRSRMRASTRPRPRRRRSCCSGRRSASSRPSPTRARRGVGEPPPGTPDDGPLIGEWEGFLVAAGHYRNGILLAPVTAEAIAALLAGEGPPPEAAPFDPRRFEV